MTDRLTHKSWEDLTTSMAEARPLITSFDILGNNIEQQRRAAGLTMMLLGLLLCVVAVSIALPFASAIAPREIAVALLVVLAFGLVSTAITYFGLAACGRNVSTAKYALNRELQEIEHLVKEEHSGWSTDDDATSLSDYAR